MKRIRIRTRKDNIKESISAQSRESRVFEDRKKKKEKKDEEKSSSNFGTEIEARDGNWPIGHMRRLWLCAQKSWMGVEGGGEGGRGGGGDGGPHYKFNLTNGSENLETMEYMKCGRVYHDGRHGVVPAAILSGPIHILRERARGWGARGYRRWNIEGRAIGKAKHTVGTTRSRETHARFLSRVQTTTCTPSIPPPRGYSGFIRSGAPGSRYVGRDL